MGYIAYLERAGHKIQFDGTGLYTLAPGWTPPTISLVPTYASGTSASAYSQPIKVGERTQQALVNVPFHIRGATSDTQVNDALSRLNAFLRDAGDESEPVYFVLLSNNDVPYQPMYGQDVRRLKISHGEAYQGAEYGIGSLNQTASPRCNMSLTVCGIDGLPQPLAHVKGCVFDLVKETADGSPLGTVIAPGSVTGGNYFTNGSFEHATWNTGWTAAPNVVAARNVDKNFVYSGETSAKLYRVSTTNITYTQSLTLTVDTYTISFFVKLATGGAITNQVSAYYNGSDRTTTFIPLSNGWYRAYSVVTGVASAMATGLSIKASAIDIYVDGFQCERLAYPTPYFDGDQLGCAWSGTAYESASTRTSADFTILLSDCFNVPAGTFEIVWRTPFDNTLAELTSTVLYLFETALGGSGTRTISLRWDAAAKLLRFSDGANNADSSVGFSAGEIVVLHCTWGPGGIELFRAGVSVGSSATYTPDTYFAADVLHLGSDVSALSKAMGVFLGFRSWSYELTNAQIAARYANISAFTTTNRRVNAIPWLWTQDADGVIDDITDADESAFGVAGGIEGDIPVSPYTQVYMGTTQTGLVVGCYDTDEFVPQGAMYDSRTTSVDSGAISVIGQWVISPIGMRNIRGNNLYIFVEVQDAGSGTLSCSHRTTITAAAGIEESDTYTIDPPVSTAYDSFVLTGLHIPETLTKQYYTIDKDSYTVDFRAERSTSGAANVVVHGILWFGRMAYLTTWSANLEYVIFHDRKIENVNIAASGMVDQAAQRTWTGDDFILVPGRVNHVFMAVAQLAAEPWDEAKISRMVYTPRYLNA